MACFEVRQRRRQRHWSANTTIHLSRRRKLYFFADHSVRPGDGSVGKMQTAVFALHFS